MEWLWQVNEQDRPLGKVERDAAHANGVLHRSGVVFLLDARGRFYLTRRASKKAIFPDRYDTSASFHVSYGDSYEQAARRESFEELGLRKPLYPIGKLRHEDPPESQFVALFVMQYDGEALLLDPSEASGGAFYEPLRVRRIVRDEPCTPWLRDGSEVLFAWQRSLRLMG